MSTNDILKFIVSCIIAAILLIGGYVAFRLYENPQPGTLASLDTSSIQKFPASICTLSGSSFTSANTGTMYVHNGLARLDMDFIQSNQSVLIHIIMDRDGMAYIWNEGGTQGIKTPFFGSSQTQSFSSEKFQCSPWWFADDSMFTLPGSVSFAGS